MSQSPPYTDRKVLYYNSYLSSGGGEGREVVGMAITRASCEAYKTFGTMPNPFEGLGVGDPS